MNDRTQKIYACLVCGGTAAETPQMPQKWYNMWYIDMSVKQPMVSAAKAPRMRYSAAYPTGAERMLRRENYCVTLTVSEGLPL